MSRWSPSSSDQKDRCFLSVHICLRARYISFGLAESGKDGDAYVNYETKERREKVEHQARSVCTL